MQCHNSHRCCLAILRLWFRYAGGVMLFLLLFRDPAYSCSCANVTPQGAFDGAYVVFTGYVIGVERITVPRGYWDASGNFIQYTDASGNPQYAPRRVVRLKVGQAWKKLPGPEVEVITGIDAGACGPLFGLNLPYLVYARKQGGTSVLETDMCSRTQELISWMKTHEDIQIWASEENAVTADFNGDGVVDFLDFMLFIEAFGTTDPKYDLDRDGGIGLLDFLRFAEWFGQKNEIISPW